MGRALMIVFFGVLAIVSAMGFQASMKCLEVQETTQAFHASESARQLAVSGAHIMASQLSYDPAFRGMTGQLAHNGGIIDAVCERVPCSSYVRISGTGIYGDISRSVVGTFSIMPDTIFGAVNGNTQVDLLGGIVIDGRDHDAEGNVIPNEGMLSVLTTDFLNQSGSAVLGGTDSEGNDYPPDEYPPPEIFEQYADLIKDYPMTPEEGLGGAEWGFPPGELKRLAQSGVNGGQYVTDSNDLVFPLSGVTYVELQDMGLWLNISFGKRPNHSKGILVCHNSTNTAQMKLLQKGVFEGILVTDHISEIHNTLIGTMILMSADQLGNCIGNGNGEILFSTEVIQANIAAAGKEVIHPVSWWE